LQGRELTEEDINRIEAGDNNFEGESRYNQQRQTMIETQPLPMN